MAVLEVQVAPDQFGDGFAITPAVQNSPPPPHLFVHGALDLKNVAEELSQDKKFPGITKKAVRDRLMKMLDQHKSNDNWKKRQQVK